MSNSYLVIHVRPGFEDDARLELEHHFEILGIQSLSVQCEENTGWLAIAITEVTKARERLKWSDLIFARQVLWSTGPVRLPALGDRISELLNTVQNDLIPLSGANAFSSFSYETPDSDDVKELSGFCKSLSRPTENALNKLKLLPKGKGAAHLPRLFLLMTSPTEVWPTFADVQNSSPWPMGIPRLKFPPQAPSRSTLKLEEAFLSFLSPGEMKIHLKEGMTAVDLGACPGGWTYQLVTRGIHVAAIDNGAIDQKLMDSGLVEHVVDDAFRYRPALPVDWLVCDVVEQPARISELMTSWILKGWCRHAIFNLKLPMKKRWHETHSCLNRLKDSCSKAGISLDIRCKQLYHDRKEVTVYAQVKS